MSFTRALRTLLPMAAIAAPFLARAAPCGESSGTSVCSPTGNLNLMQFVELALRAFVVISLPILAFFIVLSGFNFILARGKPEKLVVAKWNFLFVIIGTVLILGAWVFANLIGATVVSIQS